MKLARLLITLSIAAALVPWPGHSDAPKPEWRTITEDLERLDLTLPTGTLFSSEVMFLRTSLRRFRAGVVRAREFGLPQQEVKALATLSNAAVLINANFFDEQGKPLGLVISRGNLYQNLHRGGNTLTGVFQLKHGKASIVYRSSFLPEGVLEALQAGPRLIAGGRKVRGVRDTSGTSRRAGICIDQRGRLLVFVSVSAMGGLTIENLQSLLVSDQIGCVDALNLDGGGSAQLYVRGGMKSESGTSSEIHVRGRDEFPVGFGLFRLDP